MDIYWIWLSSMKYVGPVLQKKLISFFQSPRAVFEAEEEQLLAVPKMTKSALKSILLSRDLKVAETILRNSKSSGVNLLYYDSRYYPSFAKESREAPVVLYYRGDLREFDGSVGVVGARRCSLYGRKIAEQTGEELAALQIPLISGFAKGIDSYTQAACVKQGGYTISFLGNGPDICYPPEQRSLYHQFLEKGSVFISSFPPGTLPLPAYFLSRNALISAWSTELVVMEAGEQSGALSTVEFALKNQKPVYAVPHHIDAAEGAGTNRLLAKGIPPYLGIQSLSAAKNRIKDSGVKDVSIVTEGNPILKVISKHPTTIGELSNQLKLPTDELMDHLFNLEMERKIIVRGNVICKK